MLQNVSRIPRHGATDVQSLNGLKDNKYRNQNQEDAIGKAG